MEGNRDEAEKCLKIATKALEDGNKDRALKFLNKAEKLYSTEDAKGIVHFSFTNGNLTVTPASPAQKLAADLFICFKGYLKKQEKHLNAIITQHREHKRIHYKYTSN